MRIKNTRELRLRALSHAKADHIMQGTYGDASINGEVTFKGCAIGCLSTPHRKRELRSFVLRHQGVQGFEIRAKEQRELLAKEFGISPWLATIAEGLFEAQETHGAAIEFVKNFALALPEGADIRPRDARAYAKRYLSPIAKPGNFLVVLCDARRVGVREATNHFLSWLRTR